MQTVNQEGPTALSTRQHSARDSRRLGLGASSVAIAAVISFAGLCALPARADELQDMKQQMQSLQKQIDHLSAQQMGKAAPGSPWVIPGTNTTIKFGGFVQFDMQGDFGGDPGPTFSAASIPSDSASNTTRSNRHFRATAQNTRLTIRTTTPTPEGPVQSFVQLDLRGYVSGNPENHTNSYGPRLRHAYISWGPWLFGQTWSTFTSVGTAAETVGWVGIAGGASVRQAQARYTYAMGPAKLQLSVENPETDVKGVTTADHSTATADHYPDVVGRLLWLWRGAHLDFALLNRWLSLHQNTVRADKYAWGVTANAEVPVFAEDTFYLQSRYGKGIGRYEDSSLQSGYIVGNNLEVTKDFGYRVGFKHVFNKNFYATASGGLDAALKPNTVSDATASGDVQRFWSTSGDLFYRPLPDAVPGLWAAIEYAHGHNYKVGGAHGTDDRIDIATKFDF